MDALVQQPHERRVQRLAYFFLLVATGIAFALAWRGDDRLFGFTLPALAAPALALLGGLTGLVATVRRHAGLAVAGAAVLVLAVLPAGTAQPTRGDVVLGVLFGLAALAFAELVHMVVRYEAAHRAVDEEGVPEEHIDRVTDEAVKTLGVRVLAAAALVLSGLLLAVALSRVGPGLLQASVETTAPPGVATLTLAILGALALYVVIRGGGLHAEDLDPSHSPEVVADAQE